ncbi:MAG: stage II sporulation protein M [Terriglobales bacterium]
MISTAWLRKRREHWSQLDALLKRSEESGLRSLRHDEVQQMALLYRQAAADLSTIRQDPGGRSYARYLGSLLSRAHNTIYGAQRDKRGSFFAFFLKEYPKVFLRNLNYVVAALIVFLLGGAIGAILTFRDADFALSVLGTKMVETIERREMWTHSILAIKPVASSSIMTNNLAVAFTMFSAGITAGIGTFLLTLFNGVLIGVIGSACYISGMSLKLWSFVAPHGSLELPAVFIAAGAGFRLGHGLLFPGYHSRRDSLILSGSEAVKLLLGVVPLLIIAGVIEGFVSPTSLPVALKFLTGAALFILLQLYLFSPQWLAHRAPK